MILDDLIAGRRTGSGSTSAVVVNRQITELS